MIFHVLNFFQSRVNLILFSQEKKPSFLQPIFKLAAIVVKNTEKLVTQIECKMTNNVDDQKDLVQDIYLKAYQNLHTFQFKSKLSTWIWNIAYKTTINYLQKKKIPIIGIEKTIENRYTVLENPQSVTIRLEAIKILNNGISKLPPLYKTLITLYHLEELPNKEISEITNLPQGP